MNRKTWRLMVAAMGALNASLLLAQVPCIDGFRIEGVIADPTGAVVPGARIQASGGEKTTSDAAGHYGLSCAALGGVVITVQAQGFNGKTVSVSGQRGTTAIANVQLEIATVQDSVQVNADTVA